MQGVCILGSTGSIGSSTLDVIARNPELYRVEVLTAHHNIQKLLEQCIRFQPKYVVVADPTKAKELTLLLAEKSLSIQVNSGPAALVDCVKLPNIDTVVAAIVGAAGLLPTLEAVKQGHKVLLANKEALVMSGELFLKEVNDSKAMLLPVDSEHNAIFQCLPVNNQDASIDKQSVAKILLTGSGGPFRTTPLDELEQVTPEQACAHPNWDMGKKISVDSATMMNKGLEFIEACFLFDIAPENIQIVVHPQSIVHSMVAYIDGSVIAQLGQPDMRTPIAHTLAWPERINSGVSALDFFSMQDLSFEKPDFERFPCLQLAIQAIKSGGTAPAILNAANEVAVEAFLNREIAFTQIAKVIAKTLDLIPVDKVNNLDCVLSADSQARQTARQIIEKGES
ncbi:1-deoxy-D-xylulose-5-phosphate reductoisomerase [Aliikangiella sp. IMCC44653]